MPRKSSKEKTPPSVEPAFATVIEAADYLHLSKATIYILMDGGDLAYARFGSARRLPWAGLREYAERCTVAAS